MLSYWSTILDAEETVEKILDSPTRATTMRLPSMNTNLELKNSELIFGTETKTKAFMEEVKEGSHKGLKQNRLQVNAVKV